MHRIREILRQKWQQQRSNREVARSVGCGPSTVWKVVHAAQDAGLDLARVEALDDVELETIVAGVRPDPETRTKVLPDLAKIHEEYQRPGVTLELLHVEYLEAHPTGYRYSQFCEQYRRWLRKRKLSMRQLHRAGEKMFVDYAGQHAYVVDEQTGECVAMELFVAVLGASNLTYAEATRSQRIPDFLASHQRALEYFGGSPRIFVPDQLRSGVRTPCRYEPRIQRAYELLAEHYHAVVIPARPKKPKDKAKVEVAVQVAERWILARLRNEVFHTLEALNERIAELLEELNGRVMRRYGASRRELFERVERAHLRALPIERFAYCDFSTAGVNIDYHIAYEGHIYSVPYQLRYETEPRVDLRVTATTIEAFYRNRRVASHVRSFAKGGYTTLPEHMPESHRRHLEWTPSRLLDWAGKVGPSTAVLTEQILTTRPHPEQGYRSCLGLLRLTKEYGDERVEAACLRAVTHRAYSYRHVKSILKHDLDRQAQLPSVSPEPEGPALDHENVRGAEYYH